MKVEKIEKCLLKIKCRSQENLLWEVKKGRKKGIWRGRPCNVIYGSFYGKQFRFFASDIKRKDDIDKNIIK